MRDAAASIGGEPGRYAYDDFVIFNFPCYRAVLASVGKGALTNLLREFGAQGWTRGRPHRAPPGPMT